MLDHPEGASELIFSLLFMLSKHRSTSAASCFEDLPCLSLVINECVEVILIQIYAIRQRTEKHLSAALVVYPRISQVFRKFTSSLRVNLFPFSETCLRVFKDSSKQ